MQINVVFDSSTSSAPAGFFTAVAAAVQFYETRIVTPITITIDVGWGEVNGSTITGSDVAESHEDETAVPYDELTRALAAAATSPDDFLAVANLAPDPTDGGLIHLTDANAEALGLLADTGGVVGQIGLNASDSFTFDPNDRAVAGAFDAVGALEHEIAEVLGRIAASGKLVDGVPKFNLFDLFRYVSPGVLATTPEAASFSIDGQHLLAPFNDPTTGRDAGDWAPGVLGDSYGEFAKGTANLVSATDLRVMDVLGYTLSGPPSATAPTDSFDFKGGGTSAILFADAAGDLAQWQMTGTQISGGGGFGNPGGTWAEVGAGDFNGDGRADVLFQDASGDLAIWEMISTRIIGGGAIGNPGGSWAVKGVGDFNGDGYADILFQDALGNVAIWEMNGTSVIGGGAIGDPGPLWRAIGVGHFNGDGLSDILFQNLQGDLAIWEMNGTSIIGGGQIGNPGGTWTEKGVGDFDGDGRADILFEDAAGDYAVWEMNGTQIIGGGEIGNPGGTWQFAGIGDYNGDGMSDILFQDASGDLAIWEMNGTQIIGGGAIGNPGAQWHVLG